MVQDKPPLVAVLIRSGEKFDGKVRMKSKISRSVSVVLV